LACLAAGALAAYLILRRNRAGDPAWTPFPLTAVVHPVVLVGAAVVAITLSTLLSVLLEDRIAAPTGHFCPSPRRRSRAHGGGGDPRR
jgi:hypothetical protein